MTKCSTCGGTYAAVQADGTRYFHACPPSVAPGTLAATPIANARNENVPAPPTLAAAIAAQAFPATPAGQAQANAYANTAIVAAGTGTTLTVDQGQVIATAS